MLPQNFLYYGQAAALPERTILRAGPLTLVYEAGDLRYVRLGDKEIVRRIYVAIRDRNWGTVPNVLSNVQLDVQADSFTISYEAVNQQGEIDFRWRGRITGDSQGTLHCQLDGEAHSTFLRNRIGFCILHPSASAGDSCSVEHVDGTTEQAPLPIYITPDQPVLPFAEMRNLTQDLGNGARATMRFAGDIFEMEDQRNWTDASFKTFSTPLRLPYPVEVPKGTTISQAFTLSVAGQATNPTAPTAAQTPPAITFRPTPAVAALPLPQLGLGLASHSQSLNEQEIERLQVLRLSHLRVDLRLAAPGYIAQLDHATRDARALGVKLEVALLLSPLPAAEAELGQLRTHLERLKPLVGRWLIFPERELFNTRVPAEGLLAAARQQLADYAPDAPFAGGTNADFIFFNRFPIDPAHFDALAITLNPTVHAIDNASVIETLAAQGTLVQSAHRLADGKPVLITPVTLKMRYNPYATAAPPPVPAGELPPQVDVRQMSLFGAGWTVGSLKYLAESGVSSATYYETTGWRGVMETAYGSNVPEKFRSFPGSVFPMYHVFADVADFAGGEIVPTQSSQPLSVEGLLVRRGDRRRVLLANVTDSPQQVTVTDLPAQVQVRLLDETNAKQAMQTPEEWRDSDNPSYATVDGMLTLALPPYAVARIDG